MARPLPLDSEDKNPPKAIKDIVDGVAKRVAEIKDREIKDLLERNELWLDIPMQDLLQDLNTRGYVVLELPSEQDLSKPESTKYNFSLFKIVDRTTFEVTTTYNIEAKDKENQDAN